MVVGGASAQPTLYLAEYKFNDPLLSQMDTDGGNLVVLADVIPAADWLVVGTQVDAEDGKIYWTHGSFNGGRISRANLDGSDREVLLGGLTNPRGLALDLDAGLMFWSDTQDRKLYRAGLDGSGMTAIVSTGAQYGRPTIDPVSQAVYYGDYGTGEVRRCDYDGSGNALVIAGGSNPTGIALDMVAGRIYWTDAQTTTNYVAGANLNGTGFEVLVQFPPASSGLSDIRIDTAAGEIYWIDEITEDERGVWAASLDGSGASRIYASPTGWNAGALALVTTRCAVDLNGDGSVNTQDFLAYLNLWVAGDPIADWNDDGTVNTQDFLAFLNAWVAGC